VRPLLNDGEIDVAVGQIDRRADAVDDLHAEGFGVKLHQALSILRNDGQVANTRHKDSPVRPS